MARRRSDQFDAAEQRGQIHVEHAAYARLHYDVIAENRRKAAQRHPNRIDVRKQAEETKGAVLVGKSFPAQPIFPVE